jgi:hypothetical protein
MAAIGRDRKDDPGEVILPTRGRRRHIGDRGGLDQMRLPKESGQHGGNRSFVAKKNRPLGSTASLVEAARPAHCRHVIRPMILGAALL